MNMEIIKVEKEIKEVRMINDSKAGTLLSYQNLDTIEETAKNKLGMVEPTAEQYSYLAVSNPDLEASEDSDLQASTSKEDRVMGSWFTRLID